MRRFASALAARGAIHASRECGRKTCELGEPVSPQDIVDPNNNAVGPMPWACRGPLSGQRQSESSELNSGIDSLCTLRATLLILL